MMLIILFNAMYILKSLGKCMFVYELVLLFFSQSSNMLNQARLRVLEVREEHVSSVLEEARKRLGEVTRNPAKYGEVLKLLMVQGLLQVN